MFNPQAAEAPRKLQKVKVEGEVTLFHLPSPVVHHGLVYLLVIVRLGHHEPAAQEQHVREVSSTCRPPGEALTPDLYLPGSRLKASISALQSLSRSCRPSWELV